MRVAPPPSWSPSSSVMVDEYHLPSAASVASRLDSTLTPANMLPLLCSTSSHRHLPISRNDDGSFLLPSVKRDFGLPPSANFSMLPSSPPSRIHLPGKMNRHSGNLEEGKFAAFGWAGSLKRHFEVMGGDISHGRLFGACPRSPVIMAAAMAAKWMTRMFARSEGEQSTHDRFGAFPDN